jgi:glycosyltransferase involved in cell wall biosynthesis
VRVLIVSPWLPHPAIAHAGGQHVYHTVRSLAERGHDVHLLCYGRGEPVAQVRALEEHCASLTVVTPSYSWRLKAGRLLAGGWRRPWTLGRRAHAEARAAIRAACAGRRIDVVHLAWTEMGRYLDAVPRGVGTVLGALDVESLVRPREARLYRPGWRRLLAVLEGHRLACNERLYVRWADVTLACSEADRAHLARLGPANRVRVVGPWIDLEAMRAVGPGEVVRGRLTLMGAMDRAANAAAARFLLDDVWPIVRDRHPRATLHVVGAGPPPWLLRRSGCDPRLVVTGFVPDLAAEWAATDVAVSPSLVGGGLVVKVAQPMAAGRPVVTTTPGNEGVAAPVGVAVEVADRGPAFARAVLRLLANRERWARLAAGGRRHVQQTLDWRTSIGRLEAAYDEAVACARETG